MERAFIEYVFSVAETILAALHSVTLHLFETYEVLKGLWLEI